MNKKLREIMQKIEDKQKLAKNYMEEKDLEKANSIMDEIDELRSEYDTEKRMYDMSKIEVTEENVLKSEKETKADGFKTLFKKVSGKSLNDSEKALIVEADPSAEGANGTNYLLPEDVQLAIREKRKSYKSAKELVNVVSTTAMSGSTNFEKDSNGELSDFDDGDDISDSDDPKFERKPFKIKSKGALIYISNILAGNERAGLMSYINRWFIKKAIRTENKSIFKTLASEKTATAVKGLNALKKKINMMDPSVLIDAVIVTNQTGFSLMDDETDANGRGLLEVDPTNKSKKLYQSLPIHVFSDNELPNINGKAPMFVGSIAAGCDFMEKDNLEFAVSEHFKFNKNQTTLRIIEGFDTVQTDADAYAYFTFEEKTSTPSTPSN